MNKLWCCEDFCEWAYCENCLISTETIDKINQHNKDLGKNIDPFTPSAHLVIIES